MHFHRFRRPSASAQSHAPAHEVVRLHGDLDARTAGPTGQRLTRLIATAPDVLEIDLSDVRYLSPDGCAALFAALLVARKQGTRLIVTHADDRARSVLDQIGLSRALAWSRHRAP